MKRPAERMEETPLSELMPGFDKNAEWGRLSAKLHVQPARRLQVWKLAAAILLLVAGGAAVIVWQRENDKGLTGRAAHVAGTLANWSEGVLPPMPTQQQRPGSVAQQRDRVIVRTGKATVNAGSMDTSADEKRAIERLRRSGEFVCNSTPCPIEICITQTLKCRNEAPSAVTSCSVVDPDQARQLRFNEPQKAGRNCNVTVDEISIKRINTGEMIVLNDHSKPSTAQELFNCLTGDMECSLLAGIFKNDCDNRQQPGSLKIEKNAGSLILE